MEIAASIYGKTHFKGHISKDTFQMALKCNISLFLLFLVAVYTTTTCMAQFPSISTHVPASVPDAENGTFSLVDGAFSRPPTFWQPQKLQFMPFDPNHVMLVADTLHHAIRIVDFSSRQVSTLVAFPESGEQYGQSCINTSTCGSVHLFANGTAIPPPSPSPPPLLMPYSFAIHPYQKYVWVADTRNEALRKVNLFTKQMDVVMYGLDSEPLDLVWATPFQLFLVQSNNQLYTCTLVDAELSQDTFGPLVSMQMDTTGIQQLLGIAYNGRQNIVYLSDYKARVIYQVDLGNMQPVVVAGNTMNPAGDMVDSGLTSGNALDAKLGGPTHMVYYEKTQKLFFTDRGIASTTGLSSAVRVWDMLANKVTTLLSNNFGKAWGLALISSSLTSAKTLVFSQSDSNTLKSFGIEEGDEDETSKTCPVGYVFRSNSTPSSSCQPCDASRKPAHVKFTTSQTCRWNCSDDDSLIQQPFACYGLQITAPKPSANSQWAVLSSTNELTYVCDAGYYKSVNDGTCVLCEPGSYCDGLDFGQTGKQLCPSFPNSTSPAGSTSVQNCSCRAGFYLSQITDACMPCPKGFYCTDEGQPYQCPSNLTTLKTGKVSIFLFQTY